MKAARFTAPGAPLEITSLARPRPGPGEALVRVRAVGLCGSDVHITEGHTPTAFTPITLGHEIAGVVEAVGDGAAQQVAAGDHVFVNPMVGCLACRFCRAGEVNFCSRRKILGIQLDGALAEYVVAPVVNLTVMPEHVGFPETALIESAGTANHAVRALQAAPGDVVAVIGAGGLGMQAVRLAAARGAQVVSVDTDPVARQRCLDAGALAALDPASPGAVDQVLDAAQRPDGLTGSSTASGSGPPSQWRCGYCGSTAAAPSSASAPTRSGSPLPRTTCAGRSACPAFTATRQPTSVKLRPGWSTARSTSALRLAPSCRWTRSTQASGCSPTGRTPRCES
ncbi:MAG TPA: alcohol dehydrogenase catalytic domain-containing protein [Trebonia sp.]|nr:alcohol dehydrogenase catalytic domain-containing protein [Trebonia sp.]